ncbi:hypothetical protein GLOTRDRAFT_100564 [Gloeophyllum trabeum ATCC 11539]|uniref:Uncharacterized protein n=1 Tax=Gloeophyllum trabeum (strain ATCC 11539 / FP-39264 / Madison 617) TaxID=670483 RepID=S7RIY1_GLOTA|nr:uncharacterized protein GLOTRDRAFT_100564 [Gloeophyllum trabeum ATCC 11539]EPQ54315.1 hypothetical protein GLOTRDRAFT_100564 [Gloeophyllum trabeum ATCC 11539]
MHNRSPSELIPQSTYFLFQATNQLFITSPLLFNSFPVSVLLWVSLPVALFPPLFF